MAEEAKKSGKRPDWVLKLVKDERWTDLGVAFVNEKSDSISILSDALPQKLVLMRPRERDETKTEKK